MAFFAIHVSAVVVVMLSIGCAELDVRFRVPRAICGGRPSEFNQVCRWSDLECACVNGTFCSPDTNICEVCQTTSATCTSPCPYPCYNGGHCVWETRRCLCPPDYWGVDCSTPRVTITVPPVDKTTVRSPVKTPTVCGERKCLNGGTCLNGICTCDIGYDLPDCSLCLPHLHPRKCLNHCRLECKQGDCLTVRQRCHCSIDYTGDDCNLCIPTKAYMNCTNICPALCLNGATCNAGTRKCECSSGWRGETCYQPCPAGTFGPNCLQSCRCKVGSCDPVTGQCLCDVDPDRPECGGGGSPCHCLVDGICQTKPNCPTETQDKAAPPTAQPTTAAGQGHNFHSSSKETPPMMMLAVGTAIGAAVLLVVVVILVVCLVKARHGQRRKPGQSEEAERVPMTGTVAGNEYEDASSSPLSTGQLSKSPYRPTSGYEDVTDLHQNMPDLVRKTSEVSPYATSTNVTVHAQVPIPPPECEYSYATVKELQVMKEDGHAKEFAPRPAAATDGIYSSIPGEDGTYEDASSGEPTWVDGHPDRSSSGYAKMGPAITNNRKAFSLDRSKGEGIRSDFPTKSASLKLPKEGDKSPSKNAYVGFDPRRPSQDATKEQGGTDVFHPPPESISKPGVGKPKGEVPRYAKPNKPKSKAPEQKVGSGIPHYAKPNKPKKEVPHYAKPKKVSSMGPPNGSPNNEQPRAESTGKLPPPAAGYAHLMYSVSSKPDPNIYDYPPDE